MSTQPKHEQLTKIDKGTESKNGRSNSKNPKHRFLSKNCLYFTNIWFGALYTVVFVHDSLTKFTRCNFSEFKKIERNLEKKQILIWNLILKVLIPKVLRLQ